jgi:hypothetical protein
MFWLLIIYNDLIYKAVLTYVGLVWMKSEPPNGKEIQLKKAIRVSIKYKDDNFNPI